MTALLLPLSFVLIVVGAIGFTNAVEWLGHRMRLGEGAVGALLAAVGTALPESTIPLVALLIGGGGEEREQIAIGAIIGAPFLLGTLAMLLVAGSAHWFRGRRGERGDRVEPHIESTERDLRFFVVLFPIAIVLGAVEAPRWMLIAAAVGLVVGYGVYVQRTVKGGGEAQDEEELKALWLDPSKDDPPTTFQVVLQLVVSLAAIVGGAELFVGQVEHLAETVGIGVLIISLILAPVATELPEKANSVLWMREGKDALALGNISGAMVFQATLPVAVGLLLTDWNLEPLAIAAAAAGFLGAFVAMAGVRRRRFAGWPSVAWAALLAAFAVVAVVG